MSNTIMAVVDASTRVFLLPNMRAHHELILTLPSVDHCCSNIDLSGRSFCPHASNFTVRSNSTSFASANWTSQFLETFCQRSLCREKSQNCASTTGRNKLNLATLWSTVQVAMLHNKENVRVAMLLCTILVHSSSMELFLQTLNESNIRFFPLSLCANREH